MQALAERLHDALAGRTVAGVEPLHFSALKTVDPPATDLIGRRIQSVGRRGKYLLVVTDGPRLAVHLSQAGRIELEDPPKRTRPKGALLRLLVTGGPALLLREFGTERKAAWWVLAGDDEGPLAALGPEPGSDAFAELVRSGSDRRRLHTLLRDQRTVAGLGRGYTDDLLHRAGLSPFASLANLDAAARERLLAATDAVLAEGLAVERRRSGGLPARLGDHWTVHNRHGEPCPRCGDALQRVSYESHEVTYCPACQTGGRVLADRRLSRLLK